MEALFLSIPIPETLNLLNVWLEINEPCPKIRNAYFNIAKVSMNQNCCQFNGNFYKIIHGTSMGNVLSPFLANLFMSDFETDLYNRNLLARIWIRYVDNIFAIVKRDEIQQVLNTINNQWPSIKFTLEIENDKKLPFLDMCVTNKNGFLELSIYRKPTNIPRYIASDSYSAIQHKKAAFNSMVYRLCKIPLSISNYREELQYIKYVAELNGYEENMIDTMVFKHSKIIKKRSLTTFFNNKKESDAKRVKINYMSRKLQTN